MSKVTQIEHQDVTYASTLSVKENADRFLRTLFFIKRDPQEMVGDKFRTTSDLIESCTATGETNADNMLKRLTIGQIYLLCRNLSHKKLKHLFVDKKPFHIFTMVETNQLKGKKITNPSMMTKHYNQNKYLIIPYEFEGHSLLLVSFNKLDSIRVYDSEYDFKYRNRLTTDIEHAITEYLLAIGEKGNAPKVKFMIAPEQKQNYECGYLTVINAIKILSYIKTYGRTPKSLAYEMKNFNGYRNNLAAFSTKIRQRFYVEEMNQFKEKMAQMYDETDIKGCFNIENYSFYEMANVYQFRSEVISSIRLIVKTV